MDEKSLGVCAYSGTHTHFCNAETTVEFLSADLTILVKFEANSSTHGLTDAPLGKPH